MNSKKYEIVLSVLTILTVIVTAVGVSFAYFSTGMTGKPGEINVITDVIGNVTFDGGASFTTASEIEPDWSESKTFTITVAPSNYAQTVYVKMDYTNGFRDLTAMVFESSEEEGRPIQLETPTGEVTEDGEVIGDDKPVSDTVTLVQKTFSASDEVQSITYTLTMALDDNHQNQNYDQGKEFTATLYATLGDSNLYYNAANPNGTPNPPAAQ